MPSIHDLLAHHGDMNSGPSEAGEPELEEQPGDCLEDGAVCRGVRHRQIEPNEIFSGFCPPPFEAEQARLSLVREGRQSEATRCSHRSCDLDEGRCD